MENKSSVEEGMARVSQMLDMLLEVSFLLLCLIVSLFVCLPVCSIKSLTSVWLRSFAAARAGRRVNTGEEFLFNVFHEKEIYYTSSASSLDQVELGHHVSGPP